MPGFSEIDYWIISDIGSTDGTQKIIRNVMKGIPGELCEDVWADFATNRNMVLGATVDGSKNFPLI